MSRIEKICFVEYKNIVPYTQLQFDKDKKDADVIIFIGKNGSGKSSILHAIYGCCDGCTIGEFWFDLAIDDAKTPQDYWYEYNSHKILSVYNRNPQVRQRRIYRQSRDEARRPGRPELLPDYWESTRPTKEVGMDWSSQECHTVSGSYRWPKFELKPKYIDFRHNFTAFDVAVYSGSSFGVLHSESRAKLRIARNSKYLKDNENYYYRKSNYRVPLREEEIAQINKILDKNYSAIEIINHNYYEESASKKSSVHRVTIRINEPGKNYSDAYAGTGESAVIQLVHQLMNLKTPSIIILDEPESSLHVDAQRKLIDFLVQISFKNKHQVFISTHSPYIIENPRISKNLVFKCSPDSNGKVEIKKIIDKESAFIEVGIKRYKGIIYVEDFLTRVVFEAILAHIGYVDLYSVIYLNGFTDFRTKVFSIGNGKALCIADSDKIKEQPTQYGPNLDNLKETFQFLTESDKLPFNVDGKSNEELCQLYNEAIKNFMNGVVYLPYQDIEEFILKS